MSKLIATALVAASCAATLRADFTYQQTTQMTGGALLNMMKMGGPFTRQAREPVVSTHIIKGNRMVTLTKDHASIIDLDKESITQIDFNKKTYSVMTFAEMKQAMDDAVQQAQKQKSNEPTKAEADFKVSAKATGESKTIQGLTAKEMIITMSLEATDKESGRSGAMTIVTDNWMASVPGYDEVKAFHRKMGEKMGYLFGSGMAQLGMMRAETLKGFAEVAKETSKVDGVPVQSVMKMAGAGDGQPGDNSAAQSQQRQQSSSASPGAAAAAGLGRLAGGFGGFGRKKKDDQQQQAQPADQPQQASGPASLIETTTELTSFSSGPADASKFEIPAGFKQVEAEMTRRRR